MRLSLPQHVDHTGGADQAAQIGAAAFVLSLRARGIRDTAVLGAMERVPRELFAPRQFTDLARTDVALPLPCGQTMTGPSTVAVMLTALNVQPGLEVLEVGTGSGYITALLAKLGCIVHTIERYTTLMESARERLKIAGLADTVSFEIGDGLAERSGVRFDRVLLNGSSPSVPTTITSLISPGARLVGAVTLDGLPRLVKVDRLPDGELKQEFGGPVRLSPLVAGPATSL